MDKKKKLLLAGAAATVILVGSCCCCIAVGSDAPPRSTGTQSAQASENGGAPPSPATTPAPAPPPEPVDVSAHVTAMNEAIQEARAHMEAGDFDETPEPLTRARESLGAGMQGNPTDASLIAARDSLNALLEEFRPQLEAEVKLRAARTLANDAPEDIVEEYQAIPAAIEGLDAIGEGATPAQTREAARLKRSLEQRRSRIRNRALDAILDRRIESEGMIRVTARALANDFRDNEVRAENRYRGQRVAVDGTVQNISTGMLGGATVHLRTSNQFMPVDASLSRQDAGRLSRGNRAILGCTCTGAIIGRPRLTNCELLEFYH